MAGVFTVTVSRVAEPGAFAVNPHRRNSAIARAAASYSELAATSTACRMPSLSTSGWMGAMQQLTNDKRQLLSSIDRIHYVAGRTGLTWYVDDIAIVKSMHRVIEHHMYVVVIASVVAILLGAAFTALLRRLASADRLNPLPDEPPDVFSPEWDRDLRRLLVQADQRFPRSHPGTPRTDRESRKIRVRIFRGYMLQLFDEARRILRALKLIIITSETDRSDLASAVFKLQILFAVSVLLVEVKLTLYRIGWVGIDASSLTGSLSAIRAQLQSSVALAQPAQACHQI